MNKGAVVSGALALAALVGAACGPSVGVQGARVAVVGHTAYAYPNGLVAAGAVDAQGNAITDVVVVNEYCGPLLDPIMTHLAEDDHCARWHDGVVKDWVIGPGSSFNPGAGDTGLDYIEGA